MTMVAAITSIRLTRTSIPRPSIGGGRRRARPCAPATALLERATIAIGSGPEIALGRNPKDKGAKTKPTVLATVPVVLVLTPMPEERELEAERSAEMRSLLDTSGRSVVATCVQHLAKPTPSTYIGSGKVEELERLMAEHGAAEAVFDVQLSPRQQRNLEEELEATVLDYDELILDIFARNARTQQAMLAVELARLEYTKSRLRRMWTHLDRQTSGGSSGMGSGGLTGTGEKQIEMDRRQVRKRIQNLKERLAEIEARKDRAVAGREDAFNVALVGYTNAGKSTLMNALTSAGVLAEDRLFATLDTRTARLPFDRFTNVVLSDTVGFIRNLPPTLIASFHATLAEVREADLLLHVVDASSPIMEEQIEAVEGVLKTIGADAVPVIMVFNKIDKAYSKTILLAFRRRYKQAVSVSALNGTGLEQLRELIRTAAQARVRPVRVRFAVGDGALDSFVRSRATVKSESYDDDTAELTVETNERSLAELRAKKGISIVDE
jgi:GTP-binding protein HflX